MKLGGRCPLNKVEDPESFMKLKLEKFYRKPFKDLNINDGNLKKEFCNICENFLC